MRVVGVIDLKGGQAVHARGGRRETYGPVREAAGQAIGGNAVLLARLYRDTFGLRDIYVADLDAIASATPPSSVAGGLGQLDMHMFVDAGIKHAGDLPQVAATGARTIVVGLETLESWQQLRPICDNRGDCSIAFSLDLRDGLPMAEIGGIKESPEQICSRAVATGVGLVLVLDVARVGARSGLDLEMLRRIRAAVPGASLFAAGGIRDFRDLRQAADVGCDGALVATALHEGRMTPGDVAVALAL